MKFIKYLNLIYFYLINYEIYKIFEFNLFLLNYEIYKIFEFNLFLFNKL